mmetsp:Transcript_22597/g.21766  ORF Transcript_22597/g.21766 Transcript_22597/m.21766 type:complete len:120 (+) Transcript_22597:46-405(+)
MFIDLVEPIQQAYPLTKLLQVLPLKDEVHALLLYHGFLVCCNFVFQILTVDLAARGVQAGSRPLLIIKQVGIVVFFIVDHLRGAEQVIGIIVVSCRRQYLLQLTVLERVHLLSSLNDLI